MKKKSHEKIGFIIALAVPLIILLSLIVKPLWTLNTGENIVLKTVPVDPRDLFYGDYVTLQYEIEEVPKEKIAPSLIKELEKDNSWRKVKVYGKLISKDGFYILEELTNKKPANTPYLTGKIQYYPYFNMKEVEVYDVNFNLNRFFVPENTGIELEDLARKGQLMAHIKVKNGYAVLDYIEELKWI